MTLLTSRWQWKRVLLANLCIVAAYLATGVMSLRLDLPAGYATPLFPPAGVGLALVASGGSRMLPGVALGALLLHLSTDWIGSDVAPRVAVLAALAATTGSVMQAWLGARQFRRWIHPAIDSGRDVMRFLLLAPAACLISASVTVPSLGALGLLPENLRATSWLSWWAGDTVGVLLAAPLCWIVFGQPRQLWRRRAALVALPLLLAAGAVVATYEQAVDWERARQLLTFRLKSQQVGDLLQAQFSEHERFAYTLARSLGNVQRWQRQIDFLRIARAYHERRPELIAIEWVARISGAERVQFETWARANVNPLYQLRERTPDGRSRPAPARPEYYPLLYTDPADRPEVLGIDFGADPERGPALRQAARTRVPVATAPLRLLASGRQGIALFGAATGQDESVTGILSLVLDVASYLDSAIGRADFDGFVAAFADVSNRQAPLVLLDAIGRAPRPGDYRQLLSFGGRSYELRFAPTAAYLSQQRNWASWVVLTGGLLMTGLLGALMLLISGERAQIQALVQDRTARLREREARLEAILDNAADAIVTVDRRGALVSANHATASLFGYSPEHLRGLAFVSLVPAASGESGPELLERLAQAAPDQRELTGLQSDASAFPLEIAVSRVLLPDEKLFVCTLRDLTAQYRSQEAIYRLAHHDVLTGLENRFALDLRLEQQLAQARRAGEPLAVLFIDLDRFKKINDSHGHQVGDRLLVAAARRMKDLLRDVDALARLGGDEFIIVLGGQLSADSVRAVAVRVVQALSAPYQLDGINAHSGASVGIALYPDDGEDAETLLRHADTAMYAAKREGRNNFQFFSAAMNAATHEHLMLENRMWLALEREQFEIYLQAQVALDSGRVIGAEVLLRWHDAELGNVEPSRFIPIAEECGLILPLGDWVLARSMQLLAEWQHDELGGLRLAVNLSARQFSGGALLGRLDQLLALHRIDPALLELEITETAAMRDPENTRHLLRQLRERGYKVAIDDFGTGYSSLSYLKLFAIDRIKIDRAFVQDLETNPNDAVIVAATIGMAHALGLAVVAEGVETLAQWVFLREHRGDEAQGFLIARPMPAEQFRRFIEARAQPVPGP